MLRIKVFLTHEGWDEEKEEFVEAKVQILQLEHSLVSLSKWESKWKKPFLTNEEKTIEETIDYVKCMTVTQNVDPDVYNHLSNDDMEKINNYISDSMTATTFHFSDESNVKINKEQITSELVYYWMVALNIPFECQKWHINRLITLIKICNFKNTPPKKRNKREIMNRNAAINAARRKQLNSKG